MASNRRIGGESSESRAALLDAAEELMLEEGYAAVSSRRVAHKAGLKPQLVHYYFRTMDDLFLAAFRRRAEGALTRQAQLAGPGRSLRALWALSDDSRSTALTMEFAALANHRKSIRAEIARYAELFRSRQTEVLGALMEDRGMDTERFPPVAVMVLITGVSQILVMEEALGMSAGHAEARALVERCIEQLEGKQ
ncbi:MAG TPA: helix-turn-helix domain-containing protein [Acidimicrobiales bacterium]|jgi:AcrR family transcriptional regulator|nr:helix-turn-helix domain-containing protein [Acidimicrobiales bacterium]